MPSSVTIVEVGPRDGLQNEAASIPTADKIAFVNRLGEAGHKMIEVSAFVSPTWVPQMADAAEVFAGITRHKHTRYTALVPNLAGLERAIEARVDEIAIFAAASESFSKRNLNQTIASGESRDAARRRASAALRSFAILGLRTNVPFLIKVLEHRAFAAGDVHTGFVDEHLEDLLDAREPDDIVSAVAAFARSGPPALDTRGDAAGRDPWSTITRWGR